jgi:PAS domain S-box-containing protein
MVEVPVKAAALLVVTANPSVSRHVQGVLRQGQYEAQQVADVETARPQLESSRPSLVILEFALEASPEWCAELSRSGVNVLALIPDESLAEETFAAGAVEYVTYGNKHFSAALRSRLQRALRTQTPAVLEGARCLMWSAVVVYKDNDYHWSARTVLNADSAQQFFPLPLTEGQTYSDAWWNCKLPQEVEPTDRVYRVALQTGQPSYHQTFGCQSADGVRWLYEDVTVTRLAENHWRLQGVCSDITEYREDAEVLYQANEHLEEHIQKRTQELSETVKRLEEEIRARIHADVALRETETSYRRLIEQASDGIEIIDEQGNIIDVNPRMVEMVGYSRYELLHMNIKDLIHPDSLKESPLHIAEVQSGGTIIFERPLVRKNRTTFYVEISARLMEDGTIQCILRDITQRKLVEKDLYISQLQLQNKTNSLTIINTISDTLYQSLDVQQVVDFAVEGVVAYTNVSAICLYLYDQNSKILRLVSKRGMKDDVIKIGDTLALDSMTGLTVQNGDIILSHDLANDPRLPANDREYVLRDGFKSFYALPVLYQDEVLGAISLLFTQIYPLSPEEFETLSSVARTLGVALVNARYVAQLREESEQRRRAEAAEREQRIWAESLRDNAAALTSTLYIDAVLERVLEDVTRVVPCDAANVSIIDGDRLLIVGARGYEKRGMDDYIRTLQIPLEQAVNLRWMIEHKRPTFISDTRDYPNWVAQWQRSYVGAPIIIDGEVIGFLNLDSAIPANFNQIHADRLQAFANQASIALRNARYVAELREESEQRRRAEAAEREQRLLAEALRDSAAVLTSTLYIHEVLERILDHVTRVVPCDAANVGLVEKNMVRVVTTRNYERWDFEKEIRELRLPLEATPSFKWMYAQRKPMFINDLNVGSTWIQASPHEWRHAYLGAPIMIDGNVIGFINLDSATPGTYNESHLDRLQAFANQASIAIRNARFYEALQQQASDLELRVMERTAEVELERAQLHAILNSMTEGVVFLDQRAHARYLNPALTSLTGYSAEEWQGDTLSIGMSICDMDKDTFYALRQRVVDVLGRAGIWQENMRFHRRDGTVFDAAVTSNRVDEPGGREVGTVIMIRDISQEKALEEQKSRFVARASHELRTPLANLKTRLYLIPKQPQRFDEHMNVIRQVTQRMERLVDDLLDMSRLERGVIALHRRDTVLQHLIYDVADTQRPEADYKQIQLYVEMPDEPLYIAVDSDRMTQVITNLVANAIKYTLQGGRVTIRLHTIDATDQHPASAVISIVDSGIGIASEHLPYLFQPFFRVDENTKGTGLGLSIARDIVELHEGRIEVESKLGSGTCFRVFLALTGAGSGA